MPPVKFFGPEIVCDVPSVTPSVMPNPDRVVGLLVIPDHGTDPAEDAKLALVAVVAVPAVVAVFAAGTVPVIFDPAKELIHVGFEYAVDRDG